jgi:hypothetical protein
MTLILIAIFIFILKFFRRSKLLNGGYSLAMTYWVFSVLGSLLTLFLAYIYANGKLNPEPNNSFLAVLDFLGMMSAVSTAATFVFLYQLFAVSVTLKSRAVVKQPLMVNILLFYGLCFNLAIMGVALYFSYLSIIISLVIYFFILKKMKGN